MFKNHCRIPVDAAIKGQRTMKKLLIMLSLFCACTMQAQEQKHSTFYYQRATLFEALPTSKSDIIFLGNSITNGGEWAELLRNPHAKNRGISGDTTQGVLDRLSTITKGKPSKIFLLIGTNDLSRGKSVDEVAKNVAKIVERVKRESPKTKLYVQSVFPVNPKFNKFLGHMNRQKDIAVLNAKIKVVAARHGVTYIDVYKSLVIPSTDVMNPEYTNDGLHLLGKGYQKWVDVLKPYLK